jgi:hypothetical protein
MDLLIATDPAASPTMRAIPASVTAGFFEGQHYFIVKPPGAARCFVDDEPLVERSDGRWEWQPGFYAGQVICELELGDPSARFEYFLDVGPHPGKLGKEEFLNMVREVAAFSVDLILGTEPGRQGLGGRSRLQDPWIFYARVRAWLPAYVRAMRLIGEAPLERLRRHHERQPLHQVRRIDAATTADMARNPSLLAAVRGELTPELAIGLRDMTLRAPSVEMTLDNAANRAMAMQLHEIRSKLERLTERLRTSDEDTSVTVTSLGIRRPRRLQILRQMSAALARLAGSTPFNRVSKFELSGAGLTAVAAEPRYARAHQLGARVLRTGLAEAGGEFHYLGPSWQVYEAWCFTVIARALMERSEFEWEIAQDLDRGTMAVVGRAGARAIRCYYQPTCRSLGTSSPGHPYHSVSGERRPDILLENESPERLTFFCLDAKYRVSRQGLLDAMGSAHIYPRRHPKGGYESDSLRCFSPQVSIMFQRSRRPNTTRSIGWVRCAWEALLMR